MGHQPSNGLRLLVVEDNRDTADSLALLLSLRGHHVQVARCGMDALAVVGQTEFDVVLLDIGLPGLDDYSVARQIRDLSRSKVLRLIAITGYGQAEDFSRSAAVGIDLHLVKPVEPDDLFRIIDGSAEDRQKPATMPAAERRDSRCRRQVPSDFGLATVTRTGRLFRSWSYAQRIETKTFATERRVQYVYAHLLHIRHRFHARDLLSLRRATGN
jgi:CheY-like chemotaxis protein